MFSCSGQVNSFVHRAGHLLLACGDDTEPFWQLAPDLAHFPVPLEEMGMLSAQYCLGMRTDPALKRLLFTPLSEGHTIGRPPEGAEAK